MPFMRLWIVIWCGLSAAVATPAESKVLSVEDSIGLEVVVGAARSAEADINLWPGTSMSMDPSPDGGHVAVVIKRGNLQTAMNDAVVMRYDVQEVLKYVKNSGKSAPPSGKSLIARSSSTTNNPFEQLRWTPDGRIAFVSRDSEESRETRIYVFDPASGALKMLVSQPLQIRTFQFSPDMQHLIFVADAAPDWSARVASGYVFGAGAQLRDLITADPTYMPELAYFKLDLNTAVMSRLRFDEAIIPSLSSIEIAPDGKWAICRADVRTIPSTWRESDAYRDVYVGSFKGSLQAQGLFKGAEQLREDPAFGSRIIGVAQYALIDMVKGTVKPLIEAPIPTEPQRIHWSVDGTAVMLSAASGLTASLSGVAPPSPADSADRPGNIRIDLASRAVSLDRGLVPQESSGKAEYPRVFGLRAVPNGIFEIYASEPGTAEGLPLTKLSAKLQDIDFADLRSFSWTDKWGRAWTGTLMFPKGYESERIYPLIVETNASPSFELPSAPHAPGQILADRSVIVLRAMCDGGQSKESQMEYERNPKIGRQASRLACFEGALDRLTSEKIIDPERIGMTGFSYSGNDTTYFVTFSKYTLRAAVVVDSAISSLWNYVSAYGLQRPGVREWDAPDLAMDGITSFIGAPFAGEGIELWAQRSPTMNVDRMRTPILIEHHGTDYAPGAWDLFVILKRTNRPVELTHFPRGEHSLAMPLEQRASTQAIVDWMLFWLRDVRDGDPAKADQYKRWEGLRSQRDAALSRVSPRRNADIESY